MPCYRACARLRPAAPRGGASRRRRPLHRTASLGRCTFGSALSLGWPCLRAAALSSTARRRLRRSATRLSNQLPFLSPLPLSPCASYASLYALVRLALPLPQSLSQAPIACYTGDRTVTLASHRRHTSSLALHTISFSMLHCSNSRGPHGSCFEAPVSAGAMSSLASRSWSSYSGAGGGVRARDPAPHLRPRMPSHRCPTHLTCPTITTYTCSDRPLCPVSSSSSW